MRSPGPFSQLFEEGDDGDNSDAFSIMGAAFGNVTFPAGFEGSECTFEIETHESAGFTVPVDDAGEPITMPILAGYTVRIPDRVFPGRRLRLKSDDPQTVERTIHGHVLD